jgi:DNA primase
MQLIDIIKVGLGDPVRRGSQFFWQCPFHEDHDPSLTIMPDGRRWKCFGCNQSGDAIDWLMKYGGVSFAAAVDQTDQGVPANGIPSPSSPSHPSGTRQRIRPPGWQLKAGRIVEMCANNLQDACGEKPRQWLTDRGLKADTLSRWRIGYNPHGGTLHGLTVDGGIVIPWMRADVIDAINIRREDSTPKYKMVAGSRRRGLYLGDEVRAGRPTLLVEGEFDVLLGWQETGTIVNVATLGSATSRPDTDAIRLLLGSPLILLAYDRDDAGQKADAYWHKFTGRSRSVVFPRGKDLTEFFQLGGDIKSWVVQQLETLNPSSPQHADITPVIT